MPTGPGPRRNPFDTAVMPSRPLAERISYPSNRSRSLSPSRNLDAEAARKGVDSYRPGGKGSRSRSPLPARPREGGRRPGARREGGGGGDRGPRSGREGRAKKTQEELDAEMEDYFGHSGAGPKQESTAPAENGTASAVAGQGPADDMDMIE